MSRKPAGAHGVTTRWNTFGADVSGRTNCNGPAATAAFVATGAHVAKSGELSKR